MEKESQFTKTQKALEEWERKWLNMSKETREKLLEGMFPNDKKKNLPE